MTSPGTAERAWPVATASKPWPAARLAADRTGVSIAVHDSAIGPLTLVTGERGLQRIVFGDVVSGDVVSGDVVSGDVVSGDVVSGDVVSGDVVSGDGSAAGVAPADSFLDQTRRELDAYFAGTLREFAVPLDFRLAAPFHRTVLGKLIEVAGYGTTTTYGALAAVLGLPATAARSVGRAMALNPIPIIAPCHRVVGANGSLVGYGGGLEVKLRLLELEGALASPQLDFGS